MALKIGNRIVRLQPKKREIGVKTGVLVGGGTEPVPEKSFSGKIVLRPVKKAEKEPEMPAIETAPKELEEKEVKRKIRISRVPEKEPEKESEEIKTSFVMPQYFPY